MSDERDGSKILVRASTAKSMVSAKANDNLGITQEYNKANRDKLWDSTKGKREYKEKVFGDKNTYVDPVSGKVLHKNQNSAQNKYHMKNKDGENISKIWAEHSAETDHITALKDAHDKAKHNPFLSDDDFREIMNSDENYRLLSKKDNASKGEKSDWEIIFDKESDTSLSAKKQMAKEKIQSDVALHKKFTSKTAKNMGKEFSAGATDALVSSAIPLTVEAVKKMCAVASGEKEIKEAAKEMGKEVVGVAVAGGTNKLILNAAKLSLQKSKNTVLNNLANSNTISQIVMVASVVQDSAIKYINGEIDGKQFIEEVGENGTMMVAGMIGGEVGGEIGVLIGGAIGTAFMPGAGTAVGATVGKVIGQILGAMITTVTCSGIISIYHVSKNLDNYKLKDKQLKKLETEALKEMENQRRIFRAIVEKECQHWDEEIMLGFDMILSNACEVTYNLQGVTEGLDKILSLFGKEVAFKNLEEYEQQLDQPLKLSF